MSYSVRKVTAPLVLKIEPLYNQDTEQVPSTEHAEEHMVLLKIGFRFTCLFPRPVRCLPAITSERQLCPKVQEKKMEACCCEVSIASMKWSYVSFSCRMWQTKDKTYKP